MAIQLDGTTGISTSGNITAAGTLVVGVFNPTSISATGNVSGTNLNTNGNLSVGGNTIVAGDLTVVGNASLSGNIIGDKITNGNTSVEIPVVNAGQAAPFAISCDIIRLGWQAYNPKSCCLIHCTEIHSGHNLGCAYSLRRGGTCAGVI